MPAYHTSTRRHMCRRTIIVFSGSCSASFMPKLKSVNSTSHRTGGWEKNAITLFAQDTPTTAAKSWKWQNTLEDINSTDCNRAFRYNLLLNTVPRHTRHYLRTRKSLMETRSCYTKRRHCKINQCNAAPCWWNRLIYVDSKVFSSSDVLYTNGEKISTVTKRDNICASSSKN